MHIDAFHYVQKYRHDLCVPGLDIGGRNYNGTARGLFPNVRWLVVDKLAGTDVTMQANYTVRGPLLSNYFGIMLCTEVLEHCQNWRVILYNAYYDLEPGGRLIVTCAGPNRAPHSAITGGPITDGEWYQNMHLESMQTWLEKLDYVDIELQYNRLMTDLYFTARKRS